MKKRLVSIVTSLIFVAAFFWFYLQNPQSIKVLFELNPAVITGVIILQFFGLVINDLVIKKTVERLGTKLSFRQGLFSAYISSFGNYFLPATGGAVLRAMYLKRNHNFSYKSFVSVMYGMYIISFMATSSIGLVSLGVVYVSQGKFPVVLVLILFTLLVATISLSTSKIRIDDVVLSRLRRIGLSSLNTLIYKIEKITNGWKQIVDDKKLVFSLLSFAYLNIILRSALYFLLFKELGYEISVFQALIYNVIVSLSLYLTVTPGSIGIREAMLIFLGGSVLLNDTAILAVSIADRVSLVCLLLLMFVWFHFVLKERIKF